MIVREQRPSLIAGKNKLVHVPGVVVVSDPFSMGKFLGRHAATLTQPDTAGQASSGTSAVPTFPGATAGLPGSAAFQPSPCGPTQEVDLQHRNHAVISKPVSSPYF